MLRYRLSLDLGSTSLGWAMVRLNAEGEPCALIKSGVRIFSNGRNPKGESLAQDRRNARAMRRRRDRFLKRKARMQRLLIQYGFFPAEISARKELELLNPYRLRAEGLDRALLPQEFARALFHLNQRRGFRSNRRTDKKDNESGALKSAIGTVRALIDPQGAAGKPRTAGEFLYRRLMDSSVPPERRTVRARFHQTPVKRDDGKTRIDKSYDLYIDRVMVEAEFDALWARQGSLNPALFHEKARAELRDCLLRQRPLKPVVPGRCTLLPDKKRAPLALPSQQRFRMLQEVNHLRILGAGLEEAPLDLEQRDLLIGALERHATRKFTDIKTLLGFKGIVRFNFEDPKRRELNGNKTSAILGKKGLFGQAWFGFPEAMQDEIVLRILDEESEATLVDWLQSKTGIDVERAKAIANAPLPEGYGSLSAEALARILPELRRAVVRYDEAVVAAGFDHHSHISHLAQTGEILQLLPYYGQYLTRHVGFGTGNPEDVEERRYGRIANPTVHIGLNQVRTVVNRLIARYGLPTEVVVEVARDLKQSRRQRQEDNIRQAENQRRNRRLRAEAARILAASEERVRHADIQKLILWEELSPDIAERRCPYSGVQISPRMVLSDEVEVEHILPFSQTLDDSLNNKTLATRQANRVKGNRSPWSACADFEKQGWTYDGILARADRMPRQKRYRFGENGLQQWLRDDKDFLARALNDTRHLSRVAREYLALVCPQGTWVIPGQMTAMLRAKFGLNDILGLDGEKNRNDHRHHAVDACVIAVIDRGMLMRFSKAAADARERQLGKLVEVMPEPWQGYREQVKRSIHAIWVSHKPDHGHEGQMHNDTAYALLEDGQVAVRKVVDGVRVREIKPLKVIEIGSRKAVDRHGTLEDGSPRPYKGYKGDSNYCIEIVRDEKGRWQGEVVSTFNAYQVARKHGAVRLRDRSTSLSGKPLVMRLMIDDVVRFDEDGAPQTMRVATLSGNGQIFMCGLKEANADARNRDKEDPFSYVSKMAGSLQKVKGRSVTISPTGELRDPGFKG